MPNDPDGSDAKPPELNALLNDAAKDEPAQEQDVDLSKEFNYAVRKPKEELSKPEPKLNLEPVPEGPGLGTGSGGPMSVEEQQVKREEELRETIKRIFSKEADENSRDEPDLGR